MQTEYILIEQSLGLNGTTELVGAKNAVLVIMASLILTSGKSKLTNVPFSDDVNQMIKLLTDLGATVSINYNMNTLEVDTSSINKFQVSAEIMNKMRASILVMGPLLARFSKAQIALPGGCLIGLRPIDFHIKAFNQMGVVTDAQNEYINAEVKELKPGKFILEYPSVGATENIMMAVVLAKGTSQIINAALEPEVLDLIDILRKMGAIINILPPANIEIIGVKSLKPVEHEIIYDRLEAGSLLLAAAITGGQIELPQAPASSMEIFLDKLSQMGHNINVGTNGTGVYFKATSLPRAVSFKTMPYPGFPTDLQAPMMAALCLASGTSVIHETVYENRLIHIRELQKMGAQIKIDGTTAIINGVDQLYGTSVIATDIRASCALLLAGLAAQGKTSMTGVYHLNRGYQGILNKLKSLGAKVNLKSE